MKKLVGYRLRSFYFTICNYIALTDETSRGKRTVITTVTALLYLRSMRVAKSGTVLYDSAKVLFRNTSC